MGLLYCGDCLEVLEKKIEPESVDLIYADPPFFSNKHCGVVSARPRLTCVDLFSGAGGMSEGFRQAGFSTLAANDFNEPSAKTYRARHPGVAFLGSPIQSLTAADFLTATGLSRGQLGCLIGGPPCQAFSVYNHKRGFHDERSGLFREYLRLVDGLRPAVIVMENVTGITSAGGGRAVKEIHERLGSLGYVVEHAILKAEDFGVPQERRRIFFIGSRIGPITWPDPTHGPASKSGQSFVTVWDAISDLPPLAILEGVESVPYSTPPQTDYQREMRKSSTALTNHVAPYLAPINLERMKFIQEGGSWRDVPFDLLPAGMKKARRCDHTKRYGRLSRDGLACTILTKCDIHWGAYIHPTQERCLTAREAARLQSIPDHFQLLGPRVEQYRQIGNAVPPLLARAIAKEVSALLQRAVVPCGD